MRKGTPLFNLAKAMLSSPSHPNLQGCSGLLQHDQPIRSQRALLLFALAGDQLASCVPGLCWGKTILVVKSKFLAFFANLLRK